MGFTTIQDVTSAIPRFSRNVPGQPQDLDIQGWIDDAAGQIYALFAARNIYLDKFIPGGSPLQFIFVDLPGSNYQLNDVVTIPGGLTNATATVNTVNGTGGVTGITITTAGSGFTLPGTETPSGGHGAGLVLNV